MLSGLIFTYSWDVEIDTVPEIKHQVWMDKTKQEKDESYENIFRKIDHKPCEQIWFFILLFSFSGESSWRKLWFGGSLNFPGF